MDSPFFSHQSTDSTLRLYERAMAAAACGIVIADAKQPGYPIIYCNAAFERLTGYSLTEVIGKNCRFLQGKDTDPQAVDQLRQALKKGEDCRVLIKNYRQDGQYFWNELFISAVYDENQVLTHYIGIQNDVTERQETAASLQRFNADLEQRVSERTQALEEANLNLKQQENRLRAILENSKDAIMLKDVEGHYLLINQAGANFLNRDQSEIVGKRDEELFSPEVGRYLWSLDRQVLDSGMTQTLEEVLEIRGAKHIFLSTKSPYLSATGQLLGIIGVCRDITSIRQAEEERSRLTAILEASTDFIGISDLQGNPLWMNQQLQTLNPQGHRQTILDYHPQWTIDLIQNEGIPCALQTGVWVGEAALLNLEGQEIPVSQMILSHKNNQGEVEYLSTLMRDITSLKQAETALQQAKDQLEAVLDAVPGAIAWVDDTLHYQGVNRYLANLYQRQPEDFMGQKIGFIQANSPYAILMKSFLNSSELSLQKIVKSQLNSQDYYYLVYAQKYQQGKAAVSVSTNITELVTAEAKLKASLQEKEVLLKEIHHRVKNNLQVISSLLKLQSTYIDDEKTLSLFRDSQNRVRAMALIHERLYQSSDLAKIEAKEYIKTLVSNLVQSYSIDSNSIHLISQIDPIFLDVDTAVPCGLILNELLSNALKYAFPKGQAGTIHLEFISQPSQQYLIRVQDNGVGLPEDFQSQEWETLGLQLVWNLTGQLDGEIQVNSSKEGTEFQICFPAKKDKS